MELTGRIHEIMDEVHVSDKFYKQDFVLDVSRYDSLTGEKWENHIQLQSSNGRIPIHQVKVNDVVKVQFYIAGRYYDRRDGLGQGFFQNLICTDLEVVKSQNSNDNIKQAQHAKQIPEASKIDEKEDDMPF